jgi:cell division protein FtsB
MDRRAIEKQISDHRRDLKELRLRRAALEYQIDRAVRLLNDAEAALRELAEVGG